MSTDLHERLHNTLHEALATAEIPSYRATLADEAVLSGRRTRRRRRTVGALAGVAAAAAAVVAAAVVLGPDPVPETGPATTAPAPEVTTAAPPPDAQTEVVDGRLQVSTEVVVDDRPVVLVPEVYAPDGQSVVELVAEQSPRPAMDEVGLGGSSVVVTADDSGGGWTVAAVVRPNGTYTGQVVLYGVLPDGASELQVQVPDAPDVGPVQLVRVRGDRLPEAPVPAWGDHRDVFVLSATTPELADRTVDTTDPGITVSVQARISGEWVELGR